MWNFSLYVVFVVLIIIISTTVICSSTCENVYIVFACWLGNTYKHLGLKEHFGLGPHHFMNSYVSHLETLPSSFTTCDSATQALSPFDLTSSSQQEKEILLCPNTEEKQR